MLLLGVKLHVKCYSMLCVTRCYTTVLCCVTRCYTTVICCYSMLLDALPCACFVFASMQFQAFLQSTLSDASLESDESIEDTSSQSNPTPQKMTLYPTPSPISFPRRISWPDSVPSPRGLSIPSIPPFSSPAVGSGLIQSDSASVALSLDQLHQLFSVLPPRPVKPELCVAGCSLLESFLGSLALLFHAIALATKPYQLTFLQCDRGVYTYRTENLIFSVSIEGSVLKGLLKPARGEQRWSEGGNIIYFESILFL